MSKTLPKSIYEFIKLIRRVSDVERRIHHPSGRLENDAEHSWHMAMMVWLLAPYHERHLDILKAMKLALMHDLVEIIAGDTFAYGDVSGQKEREQKAALELFSQLPKPLRDEMFALWEEWEEETTEEVRFVRAIDRLQPAVMNLLTNGRSWQEYKVSEKMTRVNQQMIASRGENLKRMLRLILSHANKEKMFWDGKS